MSTQMNNLTICTKNHIMFNGFTIQVGMVYGLYPTIDSKGKPTKITIVSNCTPYNHKGIDGFWVHIQEQKDVEYYTKKWVTSSEYPLLYSRLCKAHRRKKAIGLEGVNYLTSNELETERWDKDENKSHFQQACHFVGKTPKSNVGATRHQIQKQWFKEKNTFTQTVNYVLYNKMQGTPYII